MFRQNKGILGIRLHQFLNSTNFFGGITFRNKQTRTQKYNIIFFPGCSFNTYSPNLVKRVYQYLYARYDQIGICTSCCHKPGEMIGSKSFYFHKEKLLKILEDHNVCEIITCCPNCTQMLSKITKRKITSIYTVLNATDKNAAAFLPVDCVLHDPCPFRENQEVQNNIRNLLWQLKVDFDEFADNRHKTKCCGKSNMLYARNKKRALSITNKRVQETERDTIITYCFSCVDSFQQVSKNAVHVLEIVFGKQNDHYWGWLNRMRLKNKINKRKLWK